MKLLTQILVVLVTTGFSAHAESAPELSERTVDVGNDVSLRVVERPASWHPDLLWCSFQAGALLPISGENRSIALLAVIA